MRRIADLHAGEVKTDVRGAYIIAEAHAAARTRYVRRSLATMKSFNSRCSLTPEPGSHWVTAVVDHEGEHRPTIASIPNAVKAGDGLPRGCSLALHSRISATYPLQPIDLSSLVIDRSGAGPI